MSRATGIEWTDATWNPIRGCSRVSEGCRHCYAETVANRFCGPGKPYEGLVQIGADGKGNGKWNGQIRFVEQRLLDPLRWKAVVVPCMPDAHVTPEMAARCKECTVRSRRIFVNSMSDLFHEGVTDEMLDRIFAVMALCPQHTFQVLTKRPERMRAYLNELVGGKRRVAIRGAEVLTGEKDSDSRAFCEAHSCMLGMMDRWSPNPLPNVWLGVSVENQKAADERIPLLLQTPAAVRFLSIEPLLGPVNLFAVPRPDDAYFRQRDELGCIGSKDEPDDYVYWQKKLLHWVIVGGESGPGARPMHPDWARSLRDQCAAAGVPFFFKQWGEWFGYTGAWRDTPIFKATGRGILWPNHVWPEPGDSVSTRCGKKAAGHLLDGVEHHAFPVPQAQSAPCNGVRA